MSGDVTLATFAAVAGESFEVETEHGLLTLELTEATASPSPPDAPREPFSLLFRGPPEPVLPQATRRFAHPSLGALDIFIVPVAADPDGVSYEAIFA